MELIELGIESAKLIARLCALHEKWMVQFAPSILLPRGDFFLQCAFFLSAEGKPFPDRSICAGGCSRDNSSWRGNGIFVNDIHSLYAGIVSVNAGTNAMLKERFQRMCSQLCYGAGLNIGESEQDSIPVCCSARKSISARSSMAFTPCQYAPHPVHESPARCFPARQLRLHGR